MTVSGVDFPDQCETCIINISKGVTLTINKEVSVPNTIFNGGNIVLNNKMAIWSAVQFNEVNVTVDNNGSIASSGVTTIKNSDFLFKGNTTATFWAQVDMTNSKMKFLGNSSLTVTSTFNLMNNSALIAGDGTKESASAIKFSGGTLNEFDNSYVSLIGSNNSYHNWAPYNAGGKSYVTKNNNINCGSGKNECSAAVVYGPATMNFAGVASSSTLPVKLSAFAVKLTGAKVDIAWATDMELNSDLYQIERSFDGINWLAVGTVKSKGNSSTVSRYSFTDGLKVAGNISYRLKMIDIDGIFAYSPIKTVKSEASVEMNIFPNPATDYVMISSRNNSDKMHIQLISQNGQILKQSIGNGRVNISVNEFNTGNYIVRVVNADGTAQCFKLMIKK